jgi:hypothetical protein
MKASDCPPHFTDFLRELVEIVNGSTDTDAEKDKELVDFVSGTIDLSLSEILSHIERLLLLVQKWGMAGIKNWLELLEKGGEAAVHADIELAIREGRAPADMFFDWAAWGQGVDESEFGRLLSIQDLPDSALAFFCNTIDISGFQIDPDLDGQPDYELGLFLESISYLEPAGITAQIARLLKEHISG